MVLLEFCLGFALVFLGIESLTCGLRRAIGHGLEGRLRAAADRPLVGSFWGFALTTVWQSSSATAVATMGLVEAGVLTLEQAAAVILGANVGTTVTAQIMTVPLGPASRLLLMAGLLLLAFSIEGGGGRASGRRQAGTRPHVAFLWGRVMAGLGAIFLGLELLAAASAPLVARPPVVGRLVVLAREPLLGVLGGTAFTAVTQSSSAAVGLLQTLVLRGIISLRSALPVLVGFNIGTTATAFLAGIPIGSEARRVAVVHLMFNLVGAALIMPAARPFSALVLATAPGDPVRQVANAHTLFNVFTAVLVFPVLPRLVRLVRRFGASNS